MDTLNNYRQIIEKILTDYIAIPYKYDDIQAQLIISQDSNHYLVITLGWENDVHVHGCLIHLEIINDKIWIHRDGTEDGIANDLVAAGIPKDKIVLAFHPVELRKYTEFAVT